MSGLWDAGSQVSAAAASSLKVLVTGASGFIGRHLLAQVPAHWQVTLLCRQQPGEALFETLGDSPRPRVVIADLARPETLAEACAEQEVIIHLAGLAHVVNTRREDQWAAHVDNTLHLLEAAQQAGVERLVYVSSIKAAQADSAYGKAKRAAEDLLLEAGKNSSLEVCCVRPTAVYGVGMKGNLMAWIRMARQGKAPPLPPRCARLAMIGVEDLARALVLAATHPGVSGQVYGLSDRHVYHLKSVEAAIRSGLGQKPLRWYLPRVFYYSAAVTGELLHRLLGRRMGFGLNAYRTLFQDAFQVRDDFEADTGFRARTNFYQALPGILAAEEDKEQGQ